MMFEHVSIVPELHRACVAGNVSEVAQYNKLLAAIVQGDSSEVKRLLDAGEDIRMTRAKALAQSGAGFTGSIRRSQRYHVRIDQSEVDLLLEAVLSPVADSKSKCEIIDLLTSRGAPVSPDFHVPHTMYSPLEAAIYVRCPEAIECLIQKGAYLVCPETGQPTDNWPIAVHEADYDTLAVLLALGPKVTGPDNDWISEALFGRLYSCYNMIDDAEWARKLQLLLANGAKVETRAADAVTALHVACGGPNYYADIGNMPIFPESVRVLLEGGADPNAVMPDGRTALHLVCEDYHYYDEDDDEYQDVLDCVELLLRHGADVDQCDDTGRPPLEAAVQAGKCAVVDLLLEHKRPHLPEYW